MITLLGQHVANTYPARGDMSKPRLREHYTKLIAAATKAAGGELFPYLEKDDVDLLSEFFTACEVRIPENMLLLTAWRHVAAACRIIMASCHWCNADVWGK